MIPDEFRKLVANRRAAAAWRGSKRTPKPIDTRGIIPVAKRVPRCEVPEVRRWAGFRLLTAVPGMTESEAHELSACAAFDDLRDLLDDFRHLACPPSDAGAWLREQIEPAAGGSSPGTG